MIKSVSIKNFRGLKDISLDSLSRVNLTIGANNVGKTSLLEGMAIAMSAGDLRVLNSLEIFRGVPQFLTARERWQWLFYNTNCEIPVEFFCLDNRDVKHESEMHLSSASMEEISTETLQKERLSSSVTPHINEDLIIDYKNSADIKSGYHRVIKMGNGIQSTTPGFIPFALTYISNKFPVKSKELAEKYSILQVQRREESVIECLQKIDKRVKRLIVNSYGTTPFLLCDIGEQNPIFPVGYMGDGLNILLNYLLSIATTKKEGYVLIDEIENGFHHSALEILWESIHQFSCLYNIQVFATTHSLECISAAQKYFEKQEGENLRVFRLDRIEENKIEVVDYNQEILKTSLDLGWEVR